MNETNIVDDEETAASLSRTLGTTDRYRTLMRNIRERERQHGHDLDTLIPIVASSSIHLRRACEHGVTCIMDWIQECNSRRWTTFFSKPDVGKVKERCDKLEDQLNELKTAMEEFRSLHRTKLVQPFEKFFDPKTKRLLKHPGEWDMFALRCVRMFDITTKSLAECGDEVAILLFCLR